MNPSATPTPLDFHGSGPHGACNAIVADQLNKRCTQPAAAYISIVSLGTGLLVDGEFLPAEQLTHSCVEHEQQVAAEGRLMSTRPLIETPAVSDAL
jgi:hypothetical protein